MIFLQADSQFTINIALLVLIIATSVGAGYLFKLFIEKFILTPKDTQSNEAEYQYQIELLQNKFSAEVIRKDEDIKMMQDELKAAEQKNFNLQVQYAKSLKQIEKTKTGHGSSDEIGGETDAETTEELNRLREKNELQEKAIGGLQAKLQEAENTVFKLTNESVNDEEKALIKSLQQKTEMLEREKEEAANQMKILQQEKHTMQDQLFQKVKLYTSQVQDLETRLSEKITEAEQHTQKYHEENDMLQRELAEYRSRAEELAAAPSQPELNDIQAIRTEVEEVTSVINNFRQHLNTALENTYPYEQLLADTEIFKKKIQTMEEEKLQYEQLKRDEIKQITDRTSELENRCYKLDHEMAHAQQLIQQLESEKQEALSLLSIITKEKERVVYESGVLKNRLEDTIESLRNELYEKENKVNELISKENKYREMLYAVKDLESQFSRLYPQLDKLEVENEIATTNGKIR